MRKSRVGLGATLLLLATPLAAEYELGGPGARHAVDTGDTPGAAIAGSVEIHEMTMTDGVVRMRPFVDGLRGREGMGRRR